MAPPPTMVTVPLENKPGTLAEIARILSEENINIEAVDCNALGEVGFVRVLTSDPTRSKRILGERGFSVTTTELIDVTLSNEPGELARVCQKLADADVNIQTCFGTATGREGTGRLLFHVDNAEAARRALKTEVGRKATITR